MPDWPRYRLNQDGSIENEYGTKWSAPLRKATTRWDKEPALKAFGPLILETRHLLDWRLQTRAGAIDLVSGYYPGIMPGQTHSMPGRLLRVDLTSSIIDRAAITWCCPNGEHSFRAFRSNEAPAVDTLAGVIAQILETGRALGLDQEDVEQPRQMSLDMSA